MLSDGANSYTYDNNGNTATKTGFTFTWNYDDRMTGVTGTSSYGYDYQGRRSSKTVGTTTTYLYDGLNLIREAGASTADYLFGPGIDEPLAMSRGGQVYYYGIDGLGSASLVTDSSGAVQDSYLYDAWGQTRTQTGSLANPFGYTAREFGEAGTLFYRARYYGSGIGRFLSEDPFAVPTIGILPEDSRPKSFRGLRPSQPSGRIDEFVHLLSRNQGGVHRLPLAPLSLYRYGRNSPAMYFDPSGMQDECASQALSLLGKCALQRGVLVSIPFGIAMVGCVGLGPLTIPCVLAVLNVEELAVGIAFATCFSEAVDQYSHCIDCLP